MACGQLCGNLGPVAVKQRTSIKNDSYDRGFEYSCVHIMRIIMVSHVYFAGGKGAGNAV